MKLEEFIIIGRFDDGTHHQIIFDPSMKAPILSACMKNGSLQVLETEIKSIKIEAHNESDSSN